MSFRYYTVCIALFQIILNTIKLSLGIVLETRLDPQAKKLSATFILSTMDLGICVIYITSGIILLLGAVKKNRMLCIIWLGAHGILFAMGVIVKIAYLTTGPRNVTILSIFGIATFFYFLVVVVSYIEELPVRGAQAGRKIST
ncbi:uncharacterized protein LOC110855094 [Folsomia candida]|uniref:uncharacterized protein LOC110855094 n=1 Tax=Folsomia candida TaxID=158441 RepID=UPI000B908CA7|nr:uncharacterized protein LOC110855094 [Folsomia candida]